MVVMGLLGGSGAWRGWGRFAAVSGALGLCSFQQRGFDPGSSFLALPIVSIVVSCWGYLLGSLII